MSVDDLDPYEVLATLEFDGVERLSPVTGGWDTAIWRVERAGQRYALRVFRPEQAPAVRREVAAMRAAASAGVPVPLVHAQGFWRDRPALLLSWLPGQTLSDRLRRRPWLAWSLGLRCGRVMAGIHRIPAPVELRDGRRDWIALCGPGEADLERRLRELDLTTDALLHLDYHPLNILVDARRVSGVLDWTNAAAGDPRADLARTLAILRLTPHEPGAGWPERAATDMVRVVLARAWRRRYEQGSGPLAQLAAFHAWAAAMMVADLAPKIGRPGIWLQAGHLEPLRRETERWKRRAGVSSPS